MASKGKNIFELKTFCVITGASQGLGRSYAVRFAEKFPAKSQLVLMARNGDGLKQTASLIQADSPKIRVKCIPVDLSDQGEGDLKGLLQAVMEEFGVSAEDFEQGLIVHNAASLGDVSKMLCELDNKQAIQKYWELNLTSTILLNTAFFRLFTGNKVQQRVAINLTSLCSIKAFKSWSLYCAGKAARDMLFATMAEEEPSIRVLSWAPGPLDTDMQVKARCSGDDEVRTTFIDMKEKGQLLTCEQSTDKLIPVLEKNTWQSGAHLDYYDV